MPRKQRIDSAAAAVKVMQGATRQIQPPSHVPLDACDWPFFESVIEEFARAEWTEHAIEIAAMLARTMANLEAEQRALRTEGFTSMTERGTPVVNPRAAIVKGLASDVLSFRRSLALHARARNGGDNRNAGTRKEQAKAIESGVLGDDIFPAPSMQ
jgi:hypothetical protein